MLKQSIEAARYELVDSAPPNGVNSYRIKYIHNEGNFTYSKSAQVSLTMDNDFKFYPNPADKVLIVRTGHTIDIQVIDAMGVIKLDKEIQPGLQIINVSMLEKGNYVLRISGKDNNRVISEHFLKN